MDRCRRERPLERRSDQVDILGALLLERRPGARFRFNLVDDGALAGETYSLIRFADLQGFAPDEFAFDGLSGELTPIKGGFDFTVSAVPEASAAWLLAVVASTAAVIT